MKNEVIRDVLMLCFIIVMSFTSGMFIGLSISEPAKLLEECEKDLKRTENCVFIAVPERDEDEDADREDVK